MVTSRFYLGAAALESDNSVVLVDMDIQYFGTWNALYLIDVGGSEMPYLRLYSPDIPLAQKRLIAQKLIEITLRALKLRAEDRHRINIQFISQPPLSGVDGPELGIPREADFFLEVNDQGLTDEKKRAFAEEVASILPRALDAKPPSRFARLLRIKANVSRQVGLQFNDLNPDQLTSWDSSFLLEHRAA